MTAKVITGRIVRTKQEYAAGRGRGRIALLLASLMIFLLPAVIACAEDDSQYICSRTEDSIYATLVEHGYSKAGACGILGNISVENPKFEADLYANNGYTYGLFQWSNTGNRLSNLTRWCNNRILYPNRTEGQIAFAISELEGGDSIACRVNEYLKTATDPALAAEEFAVGFERCIGSSGNDEADAIYTGTIYPEHTGSPYQALGWRMANARTYYEKYKDAEIGKDSSLDISGTPTAGIIAEQEEKMEEKVEEILPSDETSTREERWMSRISSLFIGYLVGNLVGVAIIERHIRRKEREEMKGKLPSLWNLLRYVGRKQALLAALIDVGKFYLALLVVYLISKGVLGSELILWTGLGVILGNDFPFWHHFNGGMGLLVTTTYLCTYMPIWGYQCCLLGLIVALIARSLPIGAIAITMFAVPYAFLCKDFEAGVFISVALALMMIRHYCFLKNYVDEKLIKAHYRRKRKKKAATEETEWLDQED